MVGSHICVPLPMRKRPIPARMSSGSPPHPLAKSQRTKQSKRCRSCAGGQPACSSNAESSVIVYRYRGA